MSNILDDLTDTDMLRTITLLTSATVARSRLAMAADTSDDEFFDIAASMAETSETISTLSAGLAAHIHDTPADWRRLTPGELAAHIDDALALVDPDKNSDPIPPHIFDLTVPGSYTQRCRALADELRADPNDFYLARLIDAITDLQDDAVAGIFRRAWPWTVNLSHNEMDQMIDELTELAELAAHSHQGVAPLLSRLHAWLRPARAVVPADLPINADRGSN